MIISIDLYETKIKVYAGDILSNILSHTFNYNKLADELIKRDEIEAVIITDMEQGSQFQTGETIRILNKF